MEAATPVFITPVEKPFSKIDEKDIKMTEIKSFDIDLTNEKFSLEIAKSENNKNIILKLYNIKEKHFKHYIMILNIESFYNLNEFFKIYKNIHELYMMLLDIINKKKYSIDIKNQEAILTLEFVMPGDKIIDVNFELQEEKVKSEELIEYLYKIVNELTKNDSNSLIKEEINNLKNENQNLKEELKNKSEELINIKNDINNLNNEMKKVKEENIEIKNKLKSFEELMNKQLSELKKKENTNLSSQINIDNINSSTNQTKNKLKEEKEGKTQ